VDDPDGYFGERVAANYDDPADPTTSPRKKRRLLASAMSPGTSRLAAAS
jgi:hypothetical protein